MIEYDTTTAYAWSYDVWHVRSNLVLELLSCSLTLGIIDVNPNE